MSDKMVTLPSGQTIPEEFYEKLMSVTAKRPRNVINKIMQDGSCTTEDLAEMGYTHAPRAKRDVVDQGIPIVTTRETNPITGRSMARYTFGDWNAYTASNAISRTRGRNALSDRLKQKLIAENGARCALYNEPMPDSLLQPDHRVPFEIGGDPEDMLDTRYFMLLSPSANRAKSWACEHCRNWYEKDVEMCMSCYYAFPENYSHVAGEETRRLDVIFREDDISVYNAIKDVAEKNDLTLQEAFKKMVDDNY